MFPQTSPECCKRCADARVSESECVLTGWNTDTLQVAATGHMAWQMPHQRTREWEEVMQKRARIKRENIRKPWLYSSLAVVNITVYYMWQDTCVCVYVNHRLKLCVSPPSKIKKNRLVNVTLLWRFTTRRHTLKEGNANCAVWGRSEVIHINEGQWMFGFIFCGQYES